MKKLGRILEKAIVIVSVEQPVSQLELGIKALSLKLKVRNPSNYFSKIQTNQLDLKEGYLEVQNAESTEIEESWSCSSEASADLQL